MPAGTPSCCAPGSMRCGRCSTRTACCITATSWVSLSPVEQSLAAVLLDRFGAVVTREMLADRAWPARRADAQRARRARAAPAPPHRALGLEIRTVRSRGYLMQSREVVLA